VHVAEKDSRAAGAAPNLKAADLDDDLIALETMLGAEEETAPAFDFDAALANVTAFKGAVARDPFSQFPENLNPSNETEEPAGPVTELFLSEDEVVSSEADTSGVDLGLELLDDTAQQQPGAPPRREVATDDDFAALDIDDFGAPPPGPSGPPPLWKPGAAQPREVTTRPPAAQPPADAKQKKSDDDVDDMLANLFGDGR
jgi:hypothetical protein